MLKILAAAIVACLMMMGAAYATTVTVNGYYTVSYSASAGNGPSITDNLGSYSSGHQNFSETLTLGGAATSPVNFFTASPASYCGYCWGTLGNETASGTITANFYFTNVTVQSGSTSANALYQAKYGGTELGCSDSGSGSTDCVDWGVTTPPSSYGAYNTTLAINLTNGDLLDITLLSAEDWSITPQITFQLSVPNGDLGQTPLPGALPLFASGLGALGLLGWRRKRKTAAA